MPRGLAPRIIYLDGNDGYWAVREGDWKLVLWKKGELELYNLELDLVEEKTLPLRIRR